MTTLDIRKQNIEEITEIQYDDSIDRIVNVGYAVILTFPEARGRKTLCTWDTFDDFIAALHKARELWGPKK